MSQRRKLVFFANSDPGVNPGNIRNAYHYALVGHRAGLEVEVRLAADAVKVALPGAIADTPDGRELRDKVAEAVARKVFVSLWPHCTGARGVTETHMAAIGGVHRLLGDILTETAEGRAEFIYIGWLTAQPAAGSVRSHIWRPMTDEERKQLEKAADFHGHICPGLVMGLRAAQIAVREVGVNTNENEVNAIVETDMWMVDGIQSLTGCTYGKGNLIHHDHGKQVYTFSRRKDGKTIRIVGRPDGLEKESPERMQLMEKTRSGTATPEERKRFNELHIARAYELMDAPEDELFSVQIVDAVVARKDRGMKRAICPRCGESVQVNRARRVGDALLCAPCAAKA